MTRSSMFVSIIAVVSLTSITAFAQVKPANEPTWYMSGGAAYYDYDGGEPINDGVALIGQVGYNFNHWWSIEGSLHILPSLSERDYTHYDPPANRTWTVHPLNDVFGSSSTWGAGLGADAIFHFTPWKRVDPYLSAGVGFLFYGEKIAGTDFNPDARQPGSNFDPAIRVGGGVMYHFNNEWAVRADYKSFGVFSKETTANSMISLGVVWYWDQHVPFRPIGTDGKLDRDGDGLFDDKEAEIGTDPNNPDTDGDGLTDGTEYYQHKTDPLKADTDSDGLKDGEELNVYATNPLLADADAGGVNDGIEVKEDNTNPNNPADDLVPFTLYIQFEYDKDVIKPLYHKQLDAFSKLLTRHAEAKVIVEGHCDRRKESDAKYNKDLSKRRAEAVVKYLVDMGKIQKTRMTAVGYGFERPKVTPVDLVNGNPGNRRVVIKISGAGTKQDMENEGFKVPEVVDLSSPDPVKPENK